jgi:hypothetical protein
MSSEACSMRSTVAISLVTGRLGHATCGSRPTAAFRCTPRWQGPYGQASIGMPRSSEGKLLCPSKVVAVLLRPCMSDLDNTSESIARFEFSFPLAAPRAVPRECEGRFFRAVTEQLLFEMSLLCGLRGCAGLPYKRDETWQMNHTACARLGARAVQVPGAFQKENGCPPPHNPSLG